MEIDDKMIGKDIKVLPKEHKSLNSDTQYNTLKMETEFLSRVWIAGKGTTVISLGKSIREFHGIENGDWVKGNITAIIKTDKKKISKKEAEEKIKEFNENDSSNIQGVEVSDTISSNQNSVSKPKRFEIN